jgi:anti-anti-sigma regulatory factor
VQAVTGLTADVTAAGSATPAVLRLPGSLDPQAALDLQDAVARCLTGEPDLVVLDLADVTTVTADAVTILSALADRAAAWPGATVALGGASPEVETALTAAGVPEHLPLFPSVLAAVARARSVRWGGPARVRLGLRPTASAAATARRVVDQVSAQWGVPGLRDTARLIVTELVSNAVRHATTELEVGLSYSGGAVHISVRDHSKTPPRRGGPVPPTVEGGRGLIVVDLMSRAWGTTPTHDGKVVWASLATA